MPTDECIAVRVKIARLREVVAVAQATGRSRHEVVGLLVDFWAWMKTEGSGGVFTTPPAPPLLSAGEAGPVGCLLDAIGGDLAFWRAVEDVGWLRLTPAGVETPRYERWLAQVVGEREDSRARRAARQARWRAKQTADAPPDGQRSHAAGDPRFAEAWAAYPLKQNKFAAEKAWDKAGITDELHGLIMARIARQRQTDDQWARGVVPHFSTWLNNRRWEDEPKRPAGAGRNPGRVAAPEGKYDGIGIRIGGQAADASDAAGRPPAR